jgi:hypothetical protein
VAGVAAYDRCVRDLSGRVQATEVCLVSKRHLFAYKIQAFARLALIIDDKLDVFHTGSWKVLYNRLHIRRSIVGHQARLSAVAGHERTWKSIDGKPL